MTETLMRKQEKLYQYLLERASVVRLPLRVPFRGITHKEAMLFNFSDLSPALLPPSSHTPEISPSLWAEWAPFQEYGPEEAATWLKSAWDFPDYGSDCGWVEINGTMPAVTPSEVPEILSRFSGVTTVKVKVADKAVATFEQSLSEDYRRLLAIREEEPDIKIRVDANAGWTVEQALKAAEMLSTLGNIEYMEQPCRTIEEMSLLKKTLAERNYAIPIAADELIRKATDPYAVIHAQACDVAVVKVAPLGGIRALRKVAALAQKNHIRLTVSSALDTSIGIGVGLVAARAVDSLAAGLGTGSLFHEDIAPPRSIKGGKLEVAPAYPEQERIEALAAPPASQQWWRERLKATIQTFSEQEVAEYSVKLGVGKACSQ